MKAWLQELLGPGGVEVLSKLYWWVIAPIISEPRFSLYFLVSTLAVAVLFYVLVARRHSSDAPGIFSYIFPRRVFLHPSALLDYKYFVVNQWLMAHLRFGGLVVGLFGLLALSQVIAAGLNAVLGARAATEPGLAALLAFTGINLLAWDFGKYVGHFLSHKIPLLWEFHKPHHSAEVLTPLSANRAHPIDIMLDLFFRLLCSGVVGGVFAYLYPSGIKELQILGFNAVALLIYYWISHLQHSHIPLGYGPWLSKVLVSPHMHQVHHSQEVHHWDRNFGFVFGLWDWMFKTIYIPQRDEAFRLGLPEGKGAGEYRTLRALYARPFTGVWRLMRRKGLPD